MNYGPLIFLGVFFALSSSWYGLIFWPQHQLGRMEPVKLEATGQTYPFRGGLAAQGAEVFRKNGCYHCHSQQVSQTGMEFDLILLAGGTNQASLVATLPKVGSIIPADQATRQVASAREKNPITVLKGVSYEEADKARNKLVAAAGKSPKLMIDLRSTGPEMRAMWGARRSVAQDFVADSPVMLGDVRHGPDLANVGERKNPAVMHLTRLYNPHAISATAMMPPFPHLFEVRKIGRAPAVNALRLAGEYAPPKGYEVVPKPEAEALVAYLASLKRDVALPEAPATSPAREVEAGDSGGGRGGGGGSAPKGGGKGKKKE